MTNCTSTALDHDAMSSIAGRLFTDTDEDRQGKNQAMRTNSPSPPPVTATAPLPTATALAPATPEPPTPVTLAAAFRGSWPGSTLRRESLAPHLPLAEWNPDLGRVGIITAAGFFKLRSNRGLNQVVDA